MIVCKDSQGLLWAKVRKEKKRLHHLCSGGVYGGGVCASTALPKPDTKSRSCTRAGGVAAVREGTQG